MPGVAAAGMADRFRLLDCPVIAGTLISGGRRSIDAAFTGAVKHP